MSYIRPEPLQPGDTIAFVAPSSPIKPGRLEAGMQFLEQKGFKIKVGKHFHDGERFLAGRDEHRASDIMTFFQDPEIKAIMAGAGGYGSQRLLSLMDYDLIQKNPKIFTGFSDTTALQLGLLRRTGLMTFSGLTFRDLDKPTIEPLIEDTLMACLLGHSYHVAEGVTVHPGMASGPLVGGTMSLMSALMGTPYQPSFKGAILLIEQVWAEPFQIDSMLSQMQMAGVFDQVAGIIIGEFADCVAHLEPERDGTVNDVIAEWVARFKVPCIKNFPYGHIDRRAILPIGGHVTLDASACRVEISGKAL